MRKTSSSTTGPGCAARSRSASVPCASSPSRRPTAVAAEAVLSPGSGSGSLPATAAVLTMIPAAPGFTVTPIVTVLELPEGTGPRSQVRVAPARVQTGGPGDEETNVTPAG